MNIKATNVENITRDTVKHNAVRSTAHNINNNITVNNINETKPIEFERVGWV
jgi:hypothetical protein